MPNWYDRRVQCLRHRLAPALVNSGSQPAIPAMPQQTTNACRSLWRLATNFWLAATLGSVFSASGFQPCLIRSFASWQIESLRPFPAPNRTCRYDGTSKGGGRMSAAAAAESEVRQTGPYRRRQRRSPLGRVIAGHDTRLRPDADDAAGRPHPCRAARGWSVPAPRWRRRSSRRSAMPSH